jgi:hypothetical protein
VAVGQREAAYGAPSATSVAVPGRTQGIAPGIAPLRSLTALTGVAAVTRLSDFNSDGFTDLVARDSAGRLWLYPGNGSGGFKARHQMGHGWGADAIVTPGDVNGDGNGDVLLKDGAGRLWLYPGNGRSGLGARRQIGNGWNYYYYYYITNAANLNGTGRPDLFARDPAGRLWLYPLSGNAVFGRRSPVTDNLTGLTLILGPGDVSGDRRADLVTRETSGRLRLYRGNGVGQVAPGTLVASSWAAYDGMVAPGNWNHAGGNDLLGWDSAGRLWFNPGNNAGGFGSRRQIGYGWNTMHYIG